MHMQGWVLSHLSGSRSTMPITMIFLPGRMPPRMRPLKGTVYAEHIDISYAQPWGEKTSVHLKIKKKGKWRLLTYQETGQILLVR